MEQNGRRDHNLKRQRSDEDGTVAIEKEQSNGEKQAKDGKAHNFGPLKQDPLAYQNALNSQVNQSGFQKNIE